MLELLGVTKTFGAVRAVNGLSLTIQRGGRFESGGTVVALPRCDDSNFVAALMRFRRTDYA